MPFRPVIFHLAHKMHKHHENNAYTTTTKPNKAKQQPTLAAILTNDSLSHACLHSHGCAMKFIRLYESIQLFACFTYRICANKNLYTSCKSATRVCNNWQIKRNGKSFFFIYLNEKNKKMHK